MVKCCKTKKDGSPCSFNAKYPENDPMFCGHHREDKPKRKSPDRTQPLLSESPPADSDGVYAGSRECGAVKNDGNICTNTIKYLIEGNYRCGTHARNKELRVELPKAPKGKGSSTTKTKISANTGKAVSPKPEVLTEAPLDDEGNPCYHSDRPCMATKRNGAPCSNNAIYMVEDELSFRCTIHSNGLVRKKLPRMSDCDGPAAPAAVVQSEAPRRPVVSSNTRRIDVTRLRRRQLDEEDELLSDQDEEDDDAIEDEDVYESE